MKKLFIVGCPRSGTTLIQQALNRHSQIVIPPETKFFHSIYRRSQSQQRRFWRRLTGDLQIDLPFPAGGVRTAGQARAVFEEMADRYCRRLGREGVAYFGDKAPEHTGRLDGIWQVFPEAKVLFVFRDGRDVALSLTRMPWVRCDVCSGFLIWMYWYKMQCRVERTGNRNVRFVRYEDAVTDPLREFASILGFLGLPYEAQVVEGSGNWEGIPEREWGWKSSAAEKITTARVGLWRRELDATQVAQLERLGGHALQRLGYELTTNGAVSLPLLFRLSCCRSALRTLWGLPWTYLANELVASVRRVVGSSSNSEEWRAESREQTAEDGHNVAHDSIVPRHVGNVPHENAGHQECW